MPGEEANLHYLTYYQKKHNSICYNVTILKYVSSHTHTYILHETFNVQTMDHGNIMTFLSICCVSVMCFFMKFIFQSKKEKKQKFKHHKRRSSMRALIFSFFIFPCFCQHVVLGLWITGCFFYQDSPSTRCLFLFESPALQECKHEFLRKYNCSADSGNFLTMYDVEIPNFEQIGPKV